MISEGGGPFGPMMGFGMEFGDDDGAMTCSGDNMMVGGDFHPFAPDMMTAPPPAVMSPRGEVFSFARDGSLCYSNTVDMHVGGARDVHGGAPYPIPHPVHAVQ